MKQILVSLCLIFSIAIHADNARELYLMKDYEAAKNSYVSLQEKSPNNFVYNYNLASTYFRMENFLLSNNFLRYHCMLGLYLKYDRQFSY